jgi:hypothetical protein
MFYRLVSKILICGLLLSLAFLSCGKRQLAGPIGDATAYPGSIVAIDNQSFLMLNTNANGAYAEGSIQRYVLNTAQTPVLQESFAVPSHGSDIALSSDNQLLALTFDGSTNPTQVMFYDYSDISNPVFLSHLTLTLYAAGGRQSVKNVSFFTPGNNIGGDFYYMYGVVLNQAQDDGSSSAIPARTFVAKIAKDFSSSTILFYLSWGVGDPNVVQYMFGYEAPTFDSTRNLLMAFPTGSINGFNNGSSAIFPPLPLINNENGGDTPLPYFSGEEGANEIGCTLLPCIQPDMRTVSLIAIDFEDFLNGVPLNNSTYFVPLAWNQNGIPYGANTNQTGGVTYTNFQSNPKNSDLYTFTFQTSFWASYWANTPDKANSNSACYISNATTTSSATSGSSINQYNLAGDNAIIFSKVGTTSGYGNTGEIFFLTGLDRLENSISIIKAAKGGTILEGELDFYKIAGYQIIDPYNVYITDPASTWGLSSSGVVNSGPLVPYMYSRTSNIDEFNSLATAATNFGVLNFGSSSTCVPFWNRNTYTGVGGYGADSSWLSASPVNVSVGAVATYLDAYVDPTQPSYYTYPFASGAELCIDLYPTADNPSVYCINFLDSDFSRFTVNTQVSPIFVRY